MDNINKLLSGLEGVKWDGLPIVDKYDFVLIASLHLFDLPFQSTASLCFQVIPQK